MAVLKGGVAFFDSGIGGLTVLNECRKIIPKEVFYYYGDNRHAPYGNRSKREIERFVLRAFKMFTRLRVRAIVLACNTATAVCVENLRKKYAIPIIGAEPAVYPACKKGGEIFVLSTSATFSSARFKKLCTCANQRFPGAKIRPFACPDLAGEIEKRIFEKDYDYTHLFPKGKPQGVVLGCTHYVYIKKQVEKFYNCPVYDGNEGIANRLKTVLFEKSRDGQPLLTYSFSTNNPYSKNMKKNKGKNSGNPLNKRRVGNMPIYFLGRCKKANKRTFEQMFAK